MTIIKSEHLSLHAILITIPYLIPFAVSTDSTPIPPDAAQLDAWFNQNVQPIAARKATIDPALVAAEASSTIIKVNANGGGQFKTITEAVNSIPPGNTKRVIISLAPGNYTEKVKIERTKGFVTIYGEDPVNRPTMVFGGTAKQYGTFYSATLTVEADNFSAVNVRFVNSAPRPALGTQGGQAVALRIGGDKASFYNCQFVGFQDTLCDDQGRHFYKDCRIEGTVDFIFGAGKSLYLNCEIFINPGDVTAVVTAQGAEAKIAISGYSFVHCTVTGGNPGSGFLGRAWRKFPTVVFSYSTLGDGIQRVGWSDNLNAANDKTVYFGEYKNTGPRSDTSGRFHFMQKFTDLQAQPFISLQHILGSTWLLPPTKL